LQWDSQNLAEDFFAPSMMRRALRQWVNWLHRLKLQAHLVSAYRSCANMRLLSHAFSAWVKDHKRRVRKLEMMDMVRERWSLSKALTRWADRLEVAIRQKDLSVEGEEFYVHSRLQNSLAKWFRDASLRYSAMHRYGVGQEHYMVVACGKAIARWSLVSARLREAREVIECGEWHYKSISTRLALSALKDKGHLLFRFRRLRTRCMKRRCFQQWKDQASQLASIRAFSTALLCREQMRLYMKYFHALSLWSSRAIRLRQASGMVELYIQQSTIHSCMKQWAMSTSRQRLMRRENMLVEKADRYFTRRYQRRALACVKEVCFNAQLTRLRDDDAVANCRQRRLVRALMGWYAGAQLRAIIRRRHRHRQLSTTLTRLRAYVMHTRVQRLVRAFRSWALVVIQRSDSRRHRLCSMMMSRWRSYHKRCARESRLIEAGRFAYDLRDLSRAFRVWKSWQQSRSSIRTAVAFHHRFAITLMFQAWRTWVMGSRAFKAKLAKIKELPFQQDEQLEVGLKRHGIRRWRSMVQQQELQEYHRLQTVSLAKRQWRHYRLKRGLLALYRHMRQGNIHELVQWAKLRRAKRSLSRWQRHTKTCSMRRPAE